MVCNLLLKPLPGRWIQFITMFIVDVDVSITMLIVDVIRPEHEFKIRTLLYSMDRRSKCGPELFGAQHGL